MAQNLDLILKDIKDPWTRENFYRIQKFIDAQGFLSAGFSARQVSISGAKTDFPIPHGLGFTPKDLIVLSSVGDQNFYFTPQKFDSTNLYVTTSGAVQIKFLVGTYKIPAQSVEYAFVPPATAVVYPTTIAEGGTGQTTQAAAITALTGTQSAGKYLRSDGTNASLSTLLGSDVSGDISGNAQNINGTLAIGNGGTNNGSLAVTAGGVLYTDGTKVVNVGAGSSGQVLKSNGASTPAWGAGAPPGAIMPYAGSTAPTGYLMCDGSAVSRTTYASLFAVISTTYGTGDGSTTFNLPDLRGIFVRGAGTSGKLNDANGTAFSGTLGTYQNDRLQGHKHTLPSSVMEGQVTASGLGTGVTGGGAYTKVGTVGDSSGGSFSSVVSTPGTDGINGTPRTGTETNPANLALNYIIAT